MLILRKTHGAEFLLRMLDAQRSSFSFSKIYGKSSKQKGSKWIMTFGLNFFFSSFSSFFVFSFHWIFVHDEWDAGEWQATLHCFVQPPPKITLSAISSLVSSSFNIQHFSLQNSLLIYSLYSIYQAIFYLLFFSFHSWKIISMCSTLSI